MTNDPDQTSPDSVSPTTTDALDAGTPAASDSRATDALDAGTYDRVLEPRSENRLPLGDGVWHQISRRYIAAQLISTGASSRLSSRPRSCSGSCSGRYGSSSPPRS